MSRTLRVVLVQFAPSSGLFHYSFQMGEALARRGHTVELLTGPRPELTSTDERLAVRSVLPTWEPGVAEHESPLYRRARRVVRGVRYLEAWRRVIRHVRLTQPDVVQLSDLHFPFERHCVAALRRAAPRAALTDLAHTPVPHSRDPHSPSLERRDRRILRAFERTYATLDAAIVLGESSRQTLLEAWPGVCRVEVIPHGLDSVFSRGPVSDVATTGPIILFFGHLERYKGLDLLLDAFVTLRDRLPEARLVIAGSAGTSFDATAFRTRATAIGGVELRIEYVPMDDVPALFNAARVVVLPYLNGNQSGVAHVAQGFARPIVATEVGDIASVVVDGSTGLLVPPTDAGALSRALEDLVRDPQQAATLGRAGYERMAAEASWADVAEQLESLYDQLLAARGA